MNELDSLIDGITKLPKPTDIEFVGRISRADLQKADDNTIASIRSQALVRCRYCKWWDGGFCNNLEASMSADDFCSLGDFI